jgi:hypothetical protein
MSSWSKRRRWLYTIFIAIILIGVVVVPLFLIFYKAPTCTDGTMNGTEQGIDCGGSCTKLCASGFITPQVAWTRFEEVAPGLYNVAAYVVNQNTDGEAFKVPYHLALYDSKGILISDFPGNMTLPPHRNTLAFQGALSVGKRTPVKALFEFTAIPEWHRRVDPLTSITVINKEYNEDPVSNSSSLTVTMKNNDVRPVGRTTVYVVLYDESSNALGFSKTIVDGIAPKSTAVAPFTWPSSRDGKVISIEVLPVAE